MKKKKREKAKLPRSNLVHFHLVSSGKITSFVQAHDSPVRTMVWSHNESWMVTGDHAGYVKYWQSNMNNVKMFQAHKEAIRGLRYTIHHTSPYVSCATVVDDPSIFAVVVRALDVILILFFFRFCAVSGRAIVILVWVHR